MNLEGTTLQESADSLLTLRRYAPYRFGGKWHLVHLKGQGMAFRAMADVKKAISRLGEEKAEVLTLGGK